MKQILLIHYGGVIQKLLAELLLKRVRGIFDFPGENSSIPPKDFFDHLIKHPLPEVFGDDKKSLKANEVIRFINKTDDIMNLKRGLLFLLELGGNFRHPPFQRDCYNPDHLNMNDTE